MGVKNRKSGGALSLLAYGGQFGGKEITDVLRLLLTQCRKLKITALILYIFGVKKRV